MQILPNIPTESQEKQISHMTLAASQPTPISSNVVSQNLVTLNELIIKNSSKIKLQNTGHIRQFLTHIKDQRIYNQDYFMVPANQNIAEKILGRFSIDSIRLFERRLKDLSVKLKIDNINSVFQQLYIQAKQDIKLPYRMNFLTRNQNIAFVEEKFISIKQILQKRGFLLTSNINELDVNLKFCVRTKDIKFSFLSKFQFANHIQNNNQLTTKSLFAKTMRESEVDEYWWQFLPMSFKVVPMAKQMIFNKNDESFQFLTQFTLLECLKILNQFKTTNYDKANFLTLQIVSFSLLRAWLNTQVVDEFPIVSRYFDIIIESDLRVILKDLPIRYPVPKFESYNQLSTENQFELQQNYIEKLSTSDQETLKKEHEFIVQQFQKNYQQSSLNDFNNVWICKPSGKSRGRGIFASDNLKQLLTLDCDQIEELPEEDLIDKDDKYIIQKYVERPFIINEYKFDIRQWVLVSSVNPLIVWQWTKPYLRFCSAKYSNSDLNNPFIHLSNNSVQKYADSFGSNIDGNMWHFTQMCEYIETHYDLSANKHLLQSKYDTSIEFPNVGDRIMYDMARIIISTLQAARFKFGEHNGFELFGYDFILDIDLQVWCLEINTSPTMEFSTDLVTTLIQEMSETYVDIISSGYCGLLLQNKNDKENFPNCTNFDEFFPNGVSSFKLIWKDNFYHKQDKTIQNFSNYVKTINIDQI